MHHGTYIYHFHWHASRVGAGLADLVVEVHGDLDGHGARHEEEVGPGERFAVEGDDLVIEGVDVGPDVLEAAVRCVAKV